MTWGMRRVHAHDMQVMQSSTEGQGEQAVCTEAFLHRHLHLDTCHGLSGADAASCVVTPASGRAGHQHEDGAETP